MNEIPSWAWIAFGVTIALFLVVDLLAHRGRHGQGRKAAIVWSVVWIGVGLGFAGFVWWLAGGKAAADYLGAYLIEKSLSVDNLFVFLIIFKMLNIPQENQHHVLSWGIFGALVLRGVFVFLGVTALERFEGVVFFFAALLLLAAWRTWKEDPSKQEDNRAVAWLSKHLPVTEKVHGDHFVVERDGRKVATPLLVAVLGLELTDIVFAIDSVPAAFSITTNEFLVYSSNAFAILGLRALYLVLAHTLGRLRYLHYGLALVLGFAAVKLMLAHWDVHIPVWLSIGLIVVTIGTSVWYSLRHTDEAEAVAHDGTGALPGG